MIAEQRHSSKYDGTICRSSSVSSSSSASTFSFSPISAFNPKDIASSSERNDSLNTNNAWSCTVCTYMNSNPLYLTCAMCGHDRTNKSEITTSVRRFAHLTSAEQEEGEEEGAAQEEEGDGGAWVRQRMDEIIRNQQEIYDNVERRRAVRQFFFNNHDAPHLGSVSSHDMENMIQEQQELLEACERGNTIAREQQRHEIPLHLEVPLLDGFCDDDASVISDITLPIGLMNQLETSATQEGWINHDIDFCNRDNSDITGPADRCTRRLEESSSTHARYITEHIVAHDHYCGTTIPVRTAARPPISLLRQAVPSALIPAPAKTMNPPPRASTPSTLWAQPLEGEFRKRKAKRRPRIFRRIFHRRQHTPRQHSQIHAILA